MNIYLDQIDIDVFASLVKRSPRWTRCLVNASATGDVILVDCLAHLLGFTPRWTRVLLRTAFFESVHDAHVPELAESVSFDTWRFNPAHRVNLVKHFFKQDSVKIDDCGQSLKIGITGINFVQFGGRAIKNVFSRVAKDVRLLGVHGSPFRCVISGSNHSDRAGRRS